MQTAFLFYSQLQQSLELHQIRSTAACETYLIVFDEFVFRFWMKTCNTSLDRVLAFILAAARNSEGNQMCYIGAPNGSQPVKLWYRQSQDKTTKKVGLNKKDKKHQLPTIKLNLICAKSSHHVPDEAHTVFLRTRASK